MFNHNDSVFAIKESNRQQCLNRDEQTKSPIHAEKVTELTHDELQHVSGGRMLYPIWVPI